MTNDTCVWVDSGKGLVETSCFDHFFYDDKDIESEVINHKKFKYCPYCGGEINEKENYS